MSMIVLLSFLGAHCIYGTCCIFYCMYGIIISDPNQKPSWGKPKGSESRFPSAIRNRSQFDRGVWHELTWEHLPN
ncbi:hypothetical protein DFH06DRAFT_1175828 [Mycena polygramma]|nr:hypothetical protein DFH06DRAFT_1175828 [Mycena polygramma]